MVVEGSKGKRHLARLATPAAQSMGVVFQETEKFDFFLPIKLASIKHDRRINEPPSRFVHQDRICETHYDLPAEFSKN